MKVKQTTLADEIRRMEEVNLLLPFPYYPTDKIEELKKKEKMISKKTDYNNVPIEYCKVCLGIHIKEISFKGHKDLATGEDKKVPYCVDCGNTTVEKTHVSEWEDFYKDRYGKKLLEE